MITFLLKKFVAKQLPDKCIDALNMFLEDYIDSNNNSNNK